MQKIIFGNVAILFLVLLAEQVVQLVLLAREHCGVVLGQQLALLPRAAHLLVIFVHDAIAVLFAVFPVADLLLAVFPEEFAKPVFFIILVIAFVNPSVWPGEYTLAVDAVVFPSALKDPSINPGVPPVTVNIIFSEVTRVATPVRPLELPLTMF